MSTSILRLAFSSLLIVLATVSCKVRNQDTSSYLAAASDDPCLASNDGLSSILRLSLENMQIYSFSPDSCAKEPVREEQNGYGLEGTDSSKTYGDISTVILIGYGKKDLVRYSPDMVVPRTRTETVDGEVVTYTEYHQESLTFSEKIEWDGFQEALEIIPDNRHVLALYGKSLDELRKAIQQDKMKHSSFYQSAPLVIIIGHGMVSDGKHVVVYSEDREGAFRQPGGNGPPQNYDELYVQRAIPSVDILRTVDQGLGGATKFCYVSGNCVAGGMVEEIEDDPQLRESILAVNTASGKTQDGRDQLAYSKGNFLEQNTTDVLKALDPKFAALNDPTQDGVYTLADHMKRIPNGYTSYPIPLMTAVYFPKDGGDVPTKVERPEIFGEPTEGPSDIPQEYGPSEREVSYQSPSGRRSYFPAEYKQFIFSQNPRVGGRPQDIILSRYKIVNTNP